MTDKELQQIKDEAFQKVNALNLDTHVRNIARSGKHDQSMHNYWSEVNGLTIMCTTGAGTNSASVRTETGRMLYECHGYGKHLECFHDGQWVDQLILEATAIEAKRQADSEESIRKQNAAEALKFEPLTGNQARHPKPHKWEIDFEDAVEWIRYTVEFHHDAPNERKQNISNLLNVLEFMTQGDVDAIMAEAEAINKKHIIIL